MTRIEFSVDVSDSLAQAVRQGGLLEPDAVEAMLWEAVRRQQVGGRDLKLVELKREIQKGIESGEATPLDMEAIKRRGRERLAAETQSPL